MSASDTGFSTEGRFFALDTPLGPDKLLVTSFTGEEGISRMFEFHLELVSTDFAIDFDRIVGANVTLRIRLEDDSERYINGYIRRFAQLPVEGHLARYEAEMVPWLWFLTRTADCRIFQDQSVPEIIEEVFQRFGFQDYENRLQGNYQPWEYCVQYRETAANFVMRLMEQEGIYFFFRHEQGRHFLVMGDRPSTHQPCPTKARARYQHAVGPGAEPLEDVIIELRYEQQMRPGKYALNDYNFQTPSTSLFSSIDSRIDQGGNKRYEVYDYPGEYLKRERGDAVVRIRMEEEETPHTILSGAGNCRAFASGFRFELTDHERQDLNGEYVLTSVSHSGRSEQYYAGSEAQGTSYSNTFTCIPFDVPFRPERLTPKPIIQGCQTAVVVGPAGEEIYVDKYGRVKVQFHWDRVGSKDDNSSCWIRVSQLWAGKNWGAMFIPRIGQEVIVDFLEGDPDRPIITGRVYNAEQMPPYDLPANQTQSGIKTRSSKGGGASNFNEIRFEDKKGQEELYIHAERDLSTVVEANESRSVGGSRSTTIQQDDTRVIKKGDSTDTLEMGNREVKLQMGNDTLTVSMGNVKIEAPMGEHKTQALTVVIEATTSLKLQCGASSIQLLPAMMTLSAPLIKIN